MLPPSQRARFLLVGAGAVGQVYGAHLAAAGHEVGYLVKPAHARATRAGFQMLPTSGDPWTFTPEIVLDDPVEATRARWDQVWLCVSSPALRGDWLPRLISAAGDAVFVVLQPPIAGAPDPLAALPPERVIRGIIAVVAWSAPLPGQSGEHGLAYWFPPLVRTRLSGPDAPVALAVEALRSGGCPAESTGDVSGAATIGSAVLLSTMAALELSGWSFQRWRKDPAGALGLRAAREALFLATVTQGLRTWPLRLLLRRPLPRLASRLAPLVAPMPLETYLRVHFTKVGDQTREALAGLVREGEARGLRVDAARALLARLPPA